MSSGEVVQGPTAAHSPVILLVEDEVLLRFSTAELLRDEGYTVIEAADASEAVDLLTSGHPFHLVLTDVRMPGEMDGVALSHAAKKLRPYLPVALLSSHLPGDATHAGDRFLAKPYSSLELFELVRALVGPEWLSRVNRTAS